MASVQLPEEKCNDLRRLIAIFLIVLLTSSFKSVPFLLTTSPYAFGFLTAIVFLALLRVVIYPSLLVVGLYLIGRGLVASKRAVVAVLLVASVVSEFAPPFLMLLVSNELPVPLSAIWSMPVEDVASLLSPALNSLVFSAPVTFFLAVGALALPTWLNTTKRK
jgi:hypothetical protein